VPSSAAKDSLDCQSCKVTGRSNKVTGKSNKVTDRSNKVTGKSNKVTGKSNKVTPWAIIQIYKGLQCSATWASLWAVDCLGDGAEKISKYFFVYKNW